jgi:hypothetical protein
MEVKKLKNAKTTILDAEDSSTTFTETKQPSGTSDSEICQIRILAPKDVTDKIAESIQALGLSTSGSQLEKGYENRYRTYLVIAIEDFRKKHGLLIPERRRGRSQ